MIKEPKLNTNKPLEECTAEEKREARVQYFSELLRIGKDVMGKYADTLEDFLNFYKYYVLLSKYLDKEEFKEDVEALKNGEIKSDIDTLCLQDDNLDSFLFDFELYDNKLK